MNFCLKIKEINVFSFGESAIFCQDVTKKGLLQVSRSGDLLDHF